MEIDELPPKPAPRARRKAPPVEEDYDAVRDDEPPPPPKARPKGRPRKPDEELSRPRPKPRVEAEAPPARVEAEAPPPAREAPPEQQLFAQLLSAQQSRRTERRERLQALFRNHYP